MTDIYDSLPPNYVSLPISVLKQAIKPDKPHEGLFLSYVQLLALAWSNRDGQTPRLREKEMYNIPNPDGSVTFGYLRIARREYFNRKREMELLGWLRSTHPATGFVQFIFPREIVDVLTGSAQPSTEVHKTAPSESRGGEESINLSLNPDSPLHPLKEESARACTFPTVKDILRHTDLLFDGAVVVSKDLDDREPLHVLAWCAYAYREKSKLNGAGGLVRNRLKDDEPPPEWAKQQWQDVLPNDFLEALGLAEYTCQTCEAKFGKLADLETHATTHPPVYACSACSQTFGSQEDLDAHYDEEHMPKRIQPDESVSKPIGEGRMTPEQAWQSVLGQLQMEMPRASFDTWVRDSRAVRYDGNTLYIGTRNAYARDWLESRLASTVSRLLVGIMNQTVAVAFVVAEDIEVEP